MLKDIFVGTTVERVMRTGEIAVKALGFLAGTRVVVLHAFDAMAKGMLAYANVEQTKIEEYVADVSRRTRVELAGFLESLDLRDIEYSVLLKEGAAAARSSPSQTKCVPILWSLAPMDGVASQGRFWAVWRRRS